MRIASNDSINFSFLFLLRKEIQSEFISSEIKISSDNSSKCLSTRSRSSTRITTYSNKSINEICLLSFSSSMTRSIEHVRWSVLSGISIHRFSFFSLFFFHLVIYHNFACFALFASIVSESWIIHDWSIWLRFTHLLAITSFDKHIFFCNLWITIQIFQRLRSFLHQADSCFRILFDSSSIRVKEISYSSTEHWVKNSLTVSFEL
jgi:hypothetical protein